MPRYTKQRDKYNCGPVAILNALRWCGINVPYASGLASLERLCVSLPPDKGCGNANFDRALRIAGEGVFSVRRVHNPLPREIKAHLKVEGAVILNYGWSEGTKLGRHYTLAVLGSTRAPFGTINALSEGKALQNHGLALFRRIGYQFNPDEHRKGWFLTRLS